MEIKIERSDIGMVIFKYTSIFELVIKRNGLVNVIEPEVQIYHST